LDGDKTCLYRYLAAAYSIILLDSTVANEIVGQDIQIETFQTKMLQRSPIRNRWPVALLVVYACLLLVGTHSPHESVITVIDMQDKLLHTLAYSGLAFLAYWAATTRDWIPASIASSPLLSAAMVILVTATFGAVDELTQFFVPGRSVELLDWMANLTGCITGATMFGIFFGRK
jgi:VanZ family protein